MDSTNIIEILAHYSVNNYWAVAFFLIPISRSTKHQTLVVAKTIKQPPYRFACAELYSWSVLTRLN
jgi:hypothetical protein